MNSNDKYLGMSLTDIDKILGGISLDSPEETPSTKIMCKSCNGQKLYMDESKGYFVCEDCGVINQKF